MRSEGAQLIEAVQETIRISREAGLPAEIYHLKASGEANWPKMDQVIKMIEDARKQGVKISADMYTYPDDHGSAARRPLSHRHDLFPDE